jgi:hypothetical protein
MTQRDADTLQELSKVLWSANIWRVTLNLQHCFEKGYSQQYMDALCLDFHEPLPVPERIRKHRNVGTLSINAGNSGVRLQQGGKHLAGGSDSVSKVLEQFSKMVGSRLLKAEVLPPGGDTTFIFDNDLTLNCFPAKSQEGDSWVICTADGNQLKLGPGARVTYETRLR